MTHACVLVAFAGCGPAQTGPAVVTPDEAAPGRAEATAVPSGHVEPAGAPEGPPFDGPRGAMPAFASPRIIRRSELREVLLAGLPAFLQRIEFEPNPVFRGGRFFGFRIARLSGDEKFWRGVDLRPGDVLVRVNGHSVERPEDALEVMRNLDAAKELDVEYERAGELRRLRYPIVEDRKPAAASRPSK